MMPNSTSTFIAKCLCGEAQLEDIDDYIDMWHESDSDKELYEFLGMTKEQYSRWIINPDVLSYIVTAHKENVNIDVIMEHINNLPITAIQHFKIKHDENVFK